MMATKTTIGNFRFVFFFLLLLRFFLIHFFPVLPLTIEHELMHMKNKNRLSFVLFSSSFYSIVPPVYHRYMRIFLVFFSLLLRACVCCYCSFFF
jgi:hypothetical protein